MYGTVVFAKALLCIGQCLMATQHALKHDLYIFCPKKTWQRPKRNFDHRFANKGHDVKNHVCPVKIGMTAIYMSLYMSHQLLDWC